MFTGITQGPFEIVALTQGDHFLVCVLQLNAHFVEGLVIGDSLAVNGICFTVEKIQGEQVSFTAGLETLRKTTVQKWQCGEKVAVERSAVFGKEIGGHLMSGHVFGVATVAAIERIGPNCAMIIQVEAEMMPYLFYKGFIGVEGSSLTINHVDRAACTFSVLIIPHTLQVTLLGEKKVGDFLNIELDAQTVTIVETVRVLLPQIRLTVD